MEHSASIFILDLTRYDEWFELGIGIRWNKLESLWDSWRCELYSVSRPKMLILTNRALFEERLRATP